MKFKLNRKYIEFIIYENDLQNFRNKEFKTEFYKYDKGYTLFIHYNTKEFGLIFTVDIDLDLEGYKKIIDNIYKDTGKKYDKNDMENHLINKAIQEIRYDISIITRLMGKEILIPTIDINEGLKKARKKEVRK